MANFIIPDEPEFSADLRKIEPTDPVHADIVNPVFEELLFNTVYLHKQYNNLKTELEKAQYVRIETVIPASGWTDSKPYTNTFVIELGMEGDYEVKVIPRYDWTEEQYEKWTNALIISGEQIDDKLILKAYGDKPDIDIPIIILVGNTILQTKGVVSIIGTSGGGSGGTGKYFGGTKLSTDANLNDDKAQYPVIQKTASGSSQTLFSIACKLPPGTYSVMMRLKVSNIAVTDNIININAKINNDSGAQLKEVFIKPNMFSFANKFQTLGFVVDFDAGKNDSLFLATTLLACSIAVKVTVDYVLIAPTFTGISSIA